MKRILSISILILLTTHISAQLGSGGGSVFPFTFPQLQTVQVNNFPTTQAVTLDSNSQRKYVWVANPSTGNGNVSIIGTPTVVVSNTNSIVAISGTPNVNISNGSLAVTGAFYPTTQPVSGTVTISNPTTSVSVSNLPATQAVSGTVSISGTPTVNVIGTSSVVSVSNFPSTQAISGNVGISGTVPVTQSGTWNIGSITSMPTTAVTGTFWQSTQPVSGTVAISNPVNSVSITGTPTVSISNLSTNTVVSVSNFPSNQNVTISNPTTSVAVNNFPSSQTISGTVTVSNPQTSVSITGTPNVNVINTNTVVSVSGTINTNITNSSLPVTGAFYPATQPISGTVTISNPQSSVSITGTPNVNIANTQTVVGTGTFATQVTSLPSLPTGANTIGAISNTAFTANAGTNLNTSALNLESTQSTINSKIPANLTVTATRLLVDGSGVTQPISGTVGVSGTVPVSGTFYQATQPISATALPLPTGASTSANQTTTNTNLATISGQLPATLGQKAQASSLPIAIQSELTTTKGNQATNALQTQDVKDAGRVAKIFSGTFTGAVTEGLVTLTPMTDGVAGTAGTSFIVTNGKTFRIQSITINTRNAGAASQGIVVNIRENTAGTVTATSSLISTVGAGTYLAIANVVGQGELNFPDGLEIKGNGTIQFGLSQIGTATAGNTVTIIGYEY